MADEMINSYVALDLETTGIGARHEKITEIGMVKVIDGETTDTYHTMVNPHREIPKRIVELTGITDDMVKDAPGIEEILDEVLAFTEDLPLLGHQIIFDYGFLVQAAVLNLPSSLYNMLPYIISLIVLAFTSKSSRAPKAEGIPYDKGQR